MKTLNQELWERYGSFELSHDKNVAIVNNLEDFIRNYTSKTIKADREHLLNHFYLEIDGIGEKSNGQQYIVEIGNHYSETEIRVSKDSILNAPQIELL